MQLFIHHETTDITDDRLIHQITRVLRMQPGDFFEVQSPDGSVRNKLCIRTITKNHIQTECVDTVSRPEHKQHVTMCIAMPNKFDKAERIVQKLSEVGVSTIVFWPAKRSQIHEMPEKKLERLHLIAQEATEQSRGWNIPEIRRAKTLDCLGCDDCFLFDYHEHSTLPMVHACRDAYTPLGTQWCGIVGPEGGFHIDEYAYFQTVKSCKQTVLGSTVLRMETAAIIAGRRLCAYKNII